MTVVSPLTLTRLRSNITHVLQDGAVPSQLNQDELINEAADMFYNLHQWNFRYRPPVDVDFHTGQTFVELPADFGEMTGYNMRDGLNFGITFTTPQQVSAHRATTTTVSQNYYWATIIQPAQTARDQAPGPPRIEIWPTPAADSVGAMTIWYRCRWQPLIETTDVADVPAYAVPALISIVRAYASGLMERLLEPSGGGEHYLIAHVMQGPIWDAAVTADGLISNDYGLITGGAIQALQPHFSWRSATASPVANPS